MIKPPIRVAIPLMILVLAFVSDVAGAYQRSNTSKKIRELIQATAAGDISKVRRVLNAGVNIDARYAQAVVRYLIEKGADVNARDREGYTALTYAENTRTMFGVEERDEIIQVLKRAQAGLKP